MKKVSYIEFRRPVPVKPAWLFYMLEWIILLLVYFIVVLLLDNICFKEDSILWMDYSIPAIVMTAFVLIVATDNVRIYSNGEICCRYCLGIIPKRFYADKVSKIRYSQYKHLFSTYYELSIEMNDLKTVKTYIEDYRLFHKIISEYNPDIELIEND